LRGTRVPGGGARGPERPSRTRGRADGLPERTEPVADPQAPRAVIDYALARRAALMDLFTGGGLRSDACDADPYLLRAARHHGERSSRRCPVCRKEDLTHVTYTYGDQLGPFSGRVRATSDLPAMARAHGEFRVYVVEVCQRCSWNHLVLSYVLGDGVVRPAPRRPHDLLD
jgi:hypothetical protein